LRRVGLSRTPRLNSHQKMGRNGNVKHVASGRSHLPETHSAKCRARFSHSRDREAGLIVAQQVGEKHRDKIRKEVAENGAFSMAQSATSLCSEPIALDCNSRACHALRSECRADLRGVRPAKSALAAILRGSGRGTTAETFLSDAAIGHGGHFLIRPSWPDPASTKSIGAFGLEPAWTESDRCPAGSWKSNTSRAAHWRGRRLRRMADAWSNPYVEQESTKNLKSARSRRDVARAHPDHVELPAELRDLLVRIHATAKGAEMAAMAPGIARAPG
jgi:hypothetical protein